MQHKAKIMSFLSPDINAALIRQGVGLRHVLRKVDHASGWTEALETLKQMQGKTAVLLGKPGVGKSQLCTEWLRHILKNTKDAKGMSRVVDNWLAMHVLYRKASQLFREIRATFDRNDKSEHDIVARFCGVRAFVVDEIDSRARTDFENRMLRDILDERYANMRDTVIVSNVTSKHRFLEQQPEYLVSRLSESGLFIECDWPSFREPRSTDER